MELCAAKSVEGSGEEGSMERFATKSLKAAAIGSHGLLVGYPTRKKADDDKAVSGMDGTMAAVAVAMALASAAAAAAAEAAKHAAAAAAAAKQAKEAAAEAAKLAEAEAEAARQTEEAEEEAFDDEDVEAEEEASDDEDESDAAYNARMSGIEYILAYKELPQYEIDLILKATDERIPFTDTERFKSLAAHPSVTQADIDAAAAEHEEQMDARARFREYVRQEYKAKGYVEVSDEYIAKRVQTEEICKKLWEGLFADSDGDTSDEEQEVGEELAQ
ncbi:hypothetical protein EJB05_55225, partial [Eragrostis curvula]